MANTRDLRFTKNAAEVSRILLAMGEDMRAKVLADGMRALCVPIEVAAKRFAKRSERTGSLRASITTKVVTYPGSGKVVGLIGPDRAYYNRGKKVGKLGALRGAARPANYAHLVEFGHRSGAKWGTTFRKGSAVETGWVPAKPFLRPAVLTTAGAQSTAFSTALARSIDRNFKRSLKGAAA